MLLYVVDAIMVCFVKTQIQQAMKGSFTIK